MSKPWSEIVVYAGTIPDRAERSRTQVLSRVRRAFDYVGWTLVEADR
jgi:hypothetical protein